MREKKKNKKKSKKSLKKLEHKTPKAIFPTQSDAITETSKSVRAISTLPSSSPFTANSSAKMPNSIAFSSDMTKLYLIDCDRNICFDLVNSNGVMVSTVKGQIFAVSAAQPRQNKVDGRKVKRLLLSTKNAQYTLIYNEDKVQLFVIGFDNIDSSISDDKPADPVGENFEIKDHVVIIRRIGNDLELDYSKR